MIIVTHTVHEITVIIKIMRIKKSGEKSVLLTFKKFDKDGSIYTH